MGLLHCLLCLTTSKKIGHLICSIQFLSPKVALYLYKSTIQHCMEYCCHVWAGALNCYLDILDKLENWYVGLVGPTLAAYLWPLGHNFFFFFRLFYINKSSLNCWCTAWRWHREPCHTFDNAIYVIVAS